jgi:hypothetical protein
MKVTTIINKVEDNAELILDITGQLVENYCGPLDRCMLDFKNILDDPQYPPTDEELEIMALKLPNLLYFTGEAVETLGIKGDIAEAVKMDIYNKVHLETSGTIADKQAAADLETQKEKLVQVSYQRAYKKIKLRMEAGYETLNSIKKVISRRLVEMQLTYESHGGKVYEP